MKTLLLAIALGSAAAQAAAPEYQIPPGATTGPETCVTTEVVSTPEGNGWGEWRPVVTREQRRVSYWTEGTDFFSLVRSEDGKHQVHTRTREVELDRSFVRRQQVVTEWTRDGASWKSQIYPVTQTITKGEGQPVRILETRGAKNFTWEVKTYGEGDDQVTERISRTPNAFSTPTRRVGNYLEICRYHLGSSALL